MANFQYVVINFIRPPESDQICHICHWQLLASISDKLNIFNLPSDRAQVAFMYFMAKP